MEKQKYFNLKQSNFIYLFVLGSFLCVGAGAGPLALLIPSLKNYLLEVTTALQLLTYIPMLIYAFNSNVDIKSALRIKKVNIKQILQIILLVLTGYVIVTFISMLWQALLGLTGLNIEIPDVLNDLFNKPAWFSIFLLCVYAPFFEEFTFRGVILSGYAANKNPWKAAVITGCFFGLMHGFLPSVAPTAFLGVIIAIVVLYTGSIFAGMIYHALHNLLAYTMLMDNWFIDLPWKLNLVPPVTTEAGQVSKFIWLLCWTAVAVIAAVILIKSLKKGYVPPERQISDPRDKSHRLLLGFALAAAFITVGLSSVTMFLPGLPQ